MPDYTILLIDYDPNSIERVRHPLTEAGYQVEIALDGVSGMEAFHRIRPNLVLVEAMLPKKHGFEVCQELKGTPLGKLTPILIMTAVYRGRKYRTQAFYIHRCDEYVEKPITDEQLLALCAKFLQNGQSGPTTSEELAPPREEVVEPALEPEIPAPRPGPPPRVAGARADVLTPEAGREPPSPPTRPERPQADAHTAPKPPARSTVQSLPQSVAPEPDEAEAEIAERLDAIFSGQGGENAEDPDAEEDRPPARPVRPAAGAAGR